MGFGIWGVAGAPLSQHLQVMASIRLLCVVFMEVPAPRWAGWFNHTAGYTISREGEICLTIRPAAGRIKYRGNRVGEAVLRFFPAAPPGAMQSFRVDRASR